MGAKAKTRDIIASVERELSQFYAFPLQSAASDHLITEAELTDLNVVKQPDERAAVWVENTAPDEDLYISIFFKPELTAALETHDPLNRLCNENLDAFCVLIEEISHFHLIINRAVSGREISKVELEWQGEIDKLLVSAIFLKRQSGHSHYLHLARKLFEEATIAPEKPAHYHDATRYAARFWYDLLSTQDGIHDPSASPRLQDILRKKYWETWQAKISRSA